MALFSRTKSIRGKTIDEITAEFKEESVRYVNNLNGEEVEKTQDSLNAYGEKLQEVSSFFSCHSFPTWCEVNSTRRSMTQYNTRRFLFQSAGDGQNVTGRKLGFIERYEHVSDEEIVEYVGKTLGLNVPQLPTIKGMLESGVAISREPQYLPAYDDLAAHYGFSCTAPHHAVVVHIDAMNNAKKNMGAVAITDVRFYRHPGGVFAATQLSIEGTAIIPAKSPVRY